MKKVLISLLISYSLLTAQNFQYIPYNLAMFDANGKVVDSGVSSVYIQPGSNTNGQVVFESQYCPTLSTNCVTIKNDGRVCQDIATTLNSAVITSPTCNFQQADIGKLVWGTTNAQTGTLLMGSVTAGTPTIILSVQSATQATTNTNALATNTAADDFIIASDDTAQHDVFTTLVGTNCATGVFPGGITAMSHAEFYNYTGCNVGGIFQSTSFYGLYPQTTHALPPWFDLSTCTNGADSLGCFYGMPGGYVNNLHMWGGGTPGGGTHNHHIVENGQGCRMTNVGLIGFQWQTAALVGLWNLSTQGQILTSGVNYFGGIATECNAQICDSHGTEYAGYLQAVVVPTGGYYMASNYDTIFGGSGNTSSSATVAVASGSTFVCEMCSIQPLNSSTDALYLGTGARAEVHQHAHINSGAIGLSAVHMAGSGATLVMEDSFFFGATGLSVFNIATGNTVIDEGGNGYQISTGEPVYTNVASTVSWNGSLSISKTAFAISNAVPTTNYGTSTITAASGVSRNFSYTLSLSGTPTSGLTVVVTFPDPFPVPPTCSGPPPLGTQALTGYSISAPSVTGVTLTYNGTLAAGNTIIQSLSCGN